MRVDEVLADFDGYMSSADHVEFYWVPHTGWALTKRNRRTDEPAAPRGRAKELIDDLILPERRPSARCAGSAAASRAGSRGWPRSCRRPGGSSTRTAATGCSRAPAGCTSTRWSTPSRGTPSRGAEPGAAAGRRGRHPAQLPRRGAGGGAGRHPAVHRPGPGHGLHRRPRVPGDARTTRTSRASSGSWTPTAGAPTGGRCTSSGHETLAERYPRWDEFQAVRRRLDPEGRFTNPYLERVLGPVTRSALDADFDAWVKLSWLSASTRPNITLCGRRFTEGYLEEYHGKWWPNHPPLHALTWANASCNGSTGHRMVTLSESLTT